MKKILLFLAKLIAISLVALPITPYFYRGYRYALSLITTGDIARATSLQGVPYDHSSSLYPFLVLVLATPKLGIKSRVLGIAGGILLYFFIDATMTVIWQGFPFVGIAKPTALHVYVSRAWAMAAHWFLPFLLWIIIAHRQITAFFTGEKQDEESRG